MEFRAGRSLEGVVGRESSLTFLQRVRAFSAKNFLQAAISLSLSSTILGCGESGQKGASGRYLPTTMVDAGEIEDTENLPDNTASADSGMVGEEESLGKIVFMGRHCGLYVMNSNGSNIREIRSGGFWPVWSPDGETIAFGSNKDENRWGCNVPNGESDIYVMNSNGGEQRNLTQGVNYHSLSQVWSPDGRKIVFEGHGGGGVARSDIYVMNSDGSEQRNLTNNPRGYNRLGNWSPDGSKIVFAGSDGDDSEIYVMNSDGSEQRKLTDNDNHDNFPLWSPDGSKIAFMSSRELSADRTYTVDRIYIMDPEGENQRRLVNDPEIYCGSPVWSPDGSKIACAGIKSGEDYADIYVANSDGSDLRNVTNTPRKEGWIDWSPDSSRIVFDEGSSYNSNAGHIYSMNADGSNKRNLTEGYRYDFGGEYPDWSPQ